MSSSVDEVAVWLADQHRRITTMTENVLAREGADRKVAFAELSRFFAAHQAAEKECLHAPAWDEFEGDTAVFDERVSKADEAAKVISELERLDPGSPEFLDRFETFRQAVVAHAEAEELEELPKLRGKVDEVELTRMKKALARVPELAFQNGEIGASFVEHLQAARAEFRSWAPTARESRMS